MKLILTALVLLNSCFGYADKDEVIITSSESDTKVFVSEHQILLRDFPNAHNPSLVKTDYGFLLSVRYIPDMQTHPEISYIGLLKLDEHLQPMGSPYLIDTRSTMKKIPSKSEDARLFKFKDDIYLIYTDDIYPKNPKIPDRRDMFVVKLEEVDGIYIAKTPFKLVNDEKSHQLIQKNWTPFEWNDNMLFVYSIDPQEILHTDLESSLCKVVGETLTPHTWDWGTLRGGTQVELVDGEYFGFFHSAIYARSDITDYKKFIHYFVGAYTFSSQPPFELTRITKFPIIDKGFYTQSNYYKRVIFPGGFAVDGDDIYMAYGKDDCEAWIAKMNKAEVFKLLKPLGTDLSLKERMRF